MKSDNTVNKMVFGYVRVSTDNQIENYSIDEQIQRIKAYCQAKDWNLLKIYTDGGFSGGNTNRPALLQLLQDIRTHAASAVVVYKLDRLSRSQKDTLTLIEDEFLPNDVDFISINENFDTSTPFGRAMIGILSVFAQLEKDQITERFTMGRIGRSKAGYYHGGSIIPRGYKYIDGELIVDEFEAIQIAEIFDSFLLGKSINAIGTEMSARYGGKWTATRISTILKNSVYTGKVKFAGVEYDGKHQPIITQSKYDEVTRLLSPAQRDKVRTTLQKTPFRANYLLSSLIFCARCGARYSANHGFYKCYSRAKPSQRFVKDPNCNNDNWIISSLDKVVIDLIQNLLDDKKLLDTLIATRITKPRVADIENITSRIKDMDNQIKRLIDLFQIGEIPMEDISKRVNLLNMQKQRLEQILEESKKDSLPQVEKFLEALAEFDHGFTDAQLEKQRLIISTLVQTITIDGDTIQISWRL